MSTGTSSPIKIGRMTVKNRTDIVKTFLGLAPEVYAVGDSSNERGNLYSATS